VQLTSKDHDGEGDFVSVGAGGWDGEHQPSWVNLDRVIRVHEAGCAGKRRPCHASRSSGSRAGCISVTAGARPGASRAGSRPARTSAPPRATSGTSMTSSARRCC